MNEETFQYSFSDIDKANGLLPKLSLEHTMLEYGEFKAGLSIINFNNISISYSSTSLERLSEGKIAEGYICFAFFLEKSTEGIINGQKLSHDIFVSIKGNNEFKFIANHKSTDFVILIKEEHFINKFEDYFENKYAHHDIIFYNLDNIQRVNNMIKIFNEIISTNKKLNEKEVENIFIHEILNIIYLSEPKQIIPKDMELARKLHYSILQNFDRAVTVTSLCKRLNISERTAYHSFKKYYSTTPNKLLEKIRLCKIYKELLNHEVSIQDIAPKYGYTHMGHFSQVFKKNFGHLPSTLKNS